ncbi:hypothetical protein [Anoxybacillus flavithermus]|uniref:Uncharacterized protein n=1 Tax=Anoxybacillus flavithermus TaxID=33934 RepID=A0AAX1ZY92_9BACL|nr:hypothetical protein [Anoxybacillus flavithermus]MBE2907577.1 hypothetical protein [Anoxybacillus flavithermus]MBE2924151.1 hypothetical protein [Anoxybacillus flavithermus]MBE2926798.1 hypothetical protein [Anoxybacillus flavithermus]MBE2935118.1 hypothetical protein [Anoxybacillus flavithermus]MBE2937609.1 hypothetical protein [Anoxybacillus flavithermus]
MKKKHLIELRNSLRRRGFWVDVIDRELVLDQWYSKSNFCEMLELLTSLQISIQIGEQGIRLEPNTLVPDEIFNRIESFNRDDLRLIPISLTIPQGWSYNPNNDLSMLEIDCGIVSLVFALNKVDLYTSMSCDGHGQREPKIWFNGHAYIETIRKILMEANREVSFAYDWEIREEGSSSVLTAKKRLSNDKWDVKKIQDDALALSEYIYNNYFRIW